MQSHCFAVLSFALALAFSFSSPVFCAERNFEEVSGSHRWKRSHEVSSRDVEDFKSPWLDTDWNALGKHRIQLTKNRLENSRITKPAKNVILFIGDGMGMSTISAGRILKAQKKNLKGEDIYLTWENFPHAGIARTYTVDRVTADSAATATAYLSGVKANFLTLGVNDKVKAGNCSNIEGNKVDSILHKSIAAGKWTGIVTTTTVTHASPGACYASTALRTWESSVADPSQADKCEDIAYQLICSKKNEDIRVMFGGGSLHFLPNRTDPVSMKRGLRTDNKNLIEEWLHMKKGKRVSVLRNRSDFDFFNPESNEYVLGLFATSHMEYEASRNETLEPSLAEMTKKALQLLKKNEQGFFLFVEGGRIDHGHHANNAFRALHDVLALEEAVKEALKITDPQETLILVTADHSHVFTMGGYSTFQEPIFGFASATQPALDGKPYTQLLYANGPGYKYHRINTSENDTFSEVQRKNLTNAEEVLQRNFLQDSAIWTASETHGGEDVPVYATGPWSHLLQGTEEQSYVAHVMMYASCVGDYRNENHCSTTSTNRTRHSLIIITFFLSKGLLLYIN